MGYLVRRSTPARAGGVAYARDEIASCWGAARYNAYLTRRSPRAAPIWTTRLRVGPCPGPLTGSPGTCSTAAWR
eukprot:3261124-Heterocapsa_arctica.AAC.1